MLFINADAWVKYIFEECTINYKNNKTEINIEKMLELIYQTPKKFLENKEVKLLKELANELKKGEEQESHKDRSGRINYVFDFLPTAKFIGPDKVRNIIDLCKAINENETWNEYQLIFFEEVLSFENSIFCKYAYPKNKILDRVLLEFLIQARDEYECIQSFIYEISLFKSIDEVGLATMELRELNKFFDTGSCRSMAIHSVKEIFVRDFTEQELYESYLLLLRGQFDLLFIENEQIENDHFLNKHWYKVVRVQAILWIKLYLEKLIETKDFQKSHQKINKISLDDLFITNYGNKGFQVKNSDKILPEMHRLLINNKLVVDETFDSFKRAFLQGEGTVNWIGKVNQLAYFIEKIKYRRIIENYDYWAKASSIFLVKNKQKTSGNLRASHNQKKHEDELVNSIVSKLLTIN